MIDTTIDFVFGGNILKKIFSIPGGKKDLTS